MRKIGNSYFLFFGELPFSTVNRFLDTLTLKTLVSLKVRTQRLTAIIQRVV